MQSRRDESPNQAVPQRQKTHRRTRIPLSCDACRTRKPKCNREHPCQNCTARHQQADCKFRGPDSPTVAIAPCGSAEHAMRQRIDHLEDLVKRVIADRERTTLPLSSNSLFYTPESPEPLSRLPAEADTSQDVAGGVKTVINGVRSVYVAGDDWYDVLQEINELKRSWTQAQDDQSSQDLHPGLSYTVDGSSLLFSQVKPVERMEILATLPPKSQLDRLIAQFFNRQYNPITGATPPIIHIQTFMREYNEHWRDPSKTNLIWLGLLFSILGITMLAYHHHGEPPEYEGVTESLFQLYRIRTAQCLLSGDIAKCRPYTIETLRFNATAELNRRDDNRRGLWLMTGVIVRAAINMGYHRDPSLSPGISVLQAEYRRRVWLSVICIDDMASFLGGFPRMTAAIHSDTAEPRNLHDWELDEDMTSLPPSRPLEEKTETTYLIVKGRLARVLGRVADFVSAPTLGVYETVVEIDRELHDAYEKFPSHMIVGPPGEDNGRFRTTAENISNLGLVAMYHIGICTLHRRFLAKSRGDDRFRLSRESCIASALAILSFQRLLEPSFYKMAQTRQMLTLGAMVLALELELRRRTPDADVSPESGVLLQALEKSCEGWAEVRKLSDEVGRVEQFPVGVLAGFGVKAAACDGVSPETAVPEVPFGVPQGSLRHDARNGGLTFDKDLADMDFDWAMWDAFIDEGNYDTGPRY